ncbi:hypothetical protein RRG08_056503 [Elysia crispata]|uniref:Uncharacterized protein n=1 Tax=Elysia crispata TaxID=231223 RepID=A0AAE1EDH6_9GAST|nr:hypothetical protein RRG08_056503 [Elysia crispata]
MHKYVDNQIQTVLCFGIGFVSHTTKDDNRSPSNHGFFQYHKPCSDYKTSCEDFVDATKELVSDASSGLISRDLHHCPLFGHGSTIRRSSLEAVLLLLLLIRHSLDFLFLHRRPNYDFLGGEASNQCKMAQRCHLAKGKKE